MNSALAEYYIKSLGVTRNGGYFEFKPMFVEKLPIPEIVESDKVVFINLVNQIIDCKKKRQSTLEIENQINTLVYKLYNVSDKEINNINRLRQNS